MPQQAAYNLIVISVDNSGLLTKKSEEFQFVLPSNTCDCCGGPFTGDVYTLSHGFPKGPLDNRLASVSWDDTGRNLCSEECVKNYVDETCDKNQNPSV
jgi:hypothetical protein